jgi:hypothetical protein
MILLRGDSVECLARSSGRRRSLQLHQMHAYLPGSHSVTFRVGGYIKLEHMNYTWLIFFRAITAGGIYF